MSTHESNHTACRETVFNDRTSECLHQSCKLHEQQGKSDDQTDRDIAGVHKSLGRFSYAAVGWPSSGHGIRQQYTHRSPMYEVAASSNLYILFKKGCFHSIYVYCVL